MYTTNAIIRNLLESKRYGGKQFSDHLYRSDEAQTANLAVAERRQQSCKNQQNENGGEESDGENEAETHQQNSRCETCNKTYLIPSSEQAEFIDQCRREYRKMTKPTNFLSEYVVSTDPVAHCRKDVLVWAPEKLTVGGLKGLWCWDISCAGHSRSFSSTKTIISVQDIEARRVDGVDDFMFIIFPKFKCKICHRYKSGLELDALEAMGVPMSVLHTCPVIPFHDSCFTKQLADLVLEMMISPSGSYRTDIYIHFSLLTYICYFTRLLRGKQCCKCN